MNEIMTFEHEQFGRIRTFEYNGLPWAIAADVCKAVELTNPTMALARLDDDEKAKFNLGLPGGETNCVNEYGIYELVLASRKKEAKAFKRWIKHEVLPSIRKTGGYITGQSIMEKYANPRELAKLLNDYADAQDKNAALEATIEANKPKVDFAEALLVCENCNYIEELAKLLCQIGMKTGRNRLFEEMGEDGFLCTRNGVKNMPTQKCVESGWLAIEKTVYEKNGKKQMGYTTKVTPKGMQYFMEYYRRKHGLEPLLTINRRTVIEQRRAPRQLKAGHGMIGQ